VGEKGLAGETSEVTLGARRPSSPLPLRCHPEPLERWFPLCWRCTGWRRWGGVQPSFRRLP